MTEIRLKKGEPVDKALRRLKKKIDREGTLKEVRNHRHFEKPSERQAPQNESGPLFRHVERPLRRYVSPLNSHCRVWSEDCARPFS